MAAANDFAVAIKGITGATGAEKVLQDLGITLYNTHTRFRTPCSSFPENFAGYLTKVKEAQNARAKSAEIAKMMEEVLSNCNPIVAQLTLLGTKFVEQALIAMANDKNADAIAAEYEKYLPKDLPDEQLTVSLIPKYLDSIKEFRKNAFKGYVELPEWEIKTGTTQAKLAVGTNSATVLKMLAKMRSTRASRLGSQNLGGAAHVTDAIIALTAPFTSSLVIPWKDGIATQRKAVGGAMQYNQESTTYEKTQGSMLLLSTALVHMKQRGSTDDKNILKKVSNFITGNVPVGGIAKYNFDILSRAWNECEAFSSPDTGGPGFQNQETNIDPIWYTYFVIVKIMKVNTAERFYIVQRAFYNICKRIRGNANVISMITSMGAAGVFGMTELANSISKCPSIYLPPWVVKSSRIYDIGACICPCDIGAPEVTITSPGISWRYFLCLDVGKKKDCINFITSLWEMEEVANAEETDDIRTAERILHQLILGRNSPLACTNFIKGNALNVTITN